MTIFGLLFIIVILVCIIIGTWIWLGNRIDQLEIYCYHARKFIAKCGLLEEWNDVIERIEDECS